MSIKLAILKSGEQVISDIKEMLSPEQKVIGYLLKNTYTVWEDDTEEVEILLEESEPEDIDKNNVDIVMTKWIRLSKSDEIMIPVDWVVTIVDPLDSLIEMYTSTFKENDSMPTSEIPGSNTDLQG
jgi:hypothetical protein